MTQKMLALAVTELGRKARLMEMPRPACDDESVIVKVHYSGVSVGTEMWIAAGRRKDYGEPPFINGYQVTGQVVEVGRGAKGVAAGDLVAAFVNGAHAQFARSHHTLVHKLPRPDLARVASLFVQASVGGNSLSMAGVNSGDNLLVVGQGLIGQMTAQLARLRGAYVIASDISPPRLSIARKHCADWVLDASAGPVSEQVKARFPGGLDVVAETTGFQSLLDDAFKCCRWDGRFIFEGFYPDQVSYTFSLPHGRQLRAYYPVFIGSAGNREGMIRLMASGKLEVEPLISHTIRSADAEEVYNRLFTPERDAYNGIVFDWRE